MFWKEQNYILQALRRTLGEGVGRDKAHRMPLPARSEKKGMVVRMRRWPDTQDSGLSSFLGTLCKVHLKIPQAVEFRQCGGGCPGWEEFTVHVSWGREERDRK